MKIFFLGSIPDHEPGTGETNLDEFKPLFDAVKETAKCAAHRGHSLLISSDSPRTIDKYVLDGINEIATENGELKVEVEVHRPEEEPPIDYDLPDNVSLVTIGHHTDKEAGLKWVASHVAILEHSDLVITFAGGNSTRLIGNIAAERGIPVVSLAMFGGSSQELFTKLKFQYLSQFAEPSSISALTSNWSTNSAGQVIGIAETLDNINRASKPSSYFISYNWNDLEYADHVEVLLRRFNRLAHRDESHFKQGSDLDESVKILINESDVFVGLFSKNFLASNWCPNELSYAERRKKAGKKPRKIILITLDNSEPPITQENNLRSTGKTREERELAIRKLLADE